ncbi:MAG TPA: cupredoxin domain-containing protein [Candidatus Limnocylindria bacterium]|nr:cupredoxin domain-containing protein [Candidatus Limnocylindria bacterium]
MSLRRARDTVLALALATFYITGCTSATPAREITIAMTEYAFLPNEIEVRAGERVRLTVRNTGRLEHDFAPDPKGAAFGLPHLHLAPGASDSRAWTAPQNLDELAIICTIQGHKDLGMSARVVVR